MPGYLIMDLFLWGITSWIIIWSWKRITIIWKWASGITAMIVMILQTFNEWLSYNVFKAWALSDDYNKFIGIDFFGAPIEEHLFWYSFAWMLPFLYAGLMKYKEN